MRALERRPKGSEVGRFEIGISVLLLKDESVDSLNKNYK